MNIQQHGAQENSPLADKTQERNPQIRDRNSPSAPEKGGGGEEKVREKKCNGNQTRKKQNEIECYLKRKTTDSAF